MVSSKSLEGIIMTLCFKMMFRSTKTPLEESVLLILMLMLVFFGGLVRFGGISDDVTSQLLCHFFVSVGKGRFLLCQFCTICRH